MGMIALYGRVLGLLGPERRLAWMLALANVALAGAQFAEPILFGRIIDALTGSQTRGEGTSFAGVAPLLGAWVAFGLFVIACGTFVALQADRLAHRRRHAILAHYFEHVLQLPLAFHGGTHSGRLMKVMLQGTDALWGLWVAFLREHLAAFVAVLILLPLSLFLNWRLAVLLVVAVRRLRAAHGADRAQDPQTAERRRGALFRSCRTRRRHARQCGAGAEFFTHRG